ncbi:RNA 2',3'-cyclic phosphodiesterase [Streptomyces odontomachi]|uniref:RNA 2',3'-cyclic phosphodiesterase n=1 Tax=Streptomyces odontomachi TaxID=2944940 RepID=UPI00210CD3FA|nr:RNA 2',3'-cyclic phosphodiesterase [Streptomyces sp. ODS25]
MRLFAAVLPPESALAELAAAVDPVRERTDPGDGSGAERGGLRWTLRASWHFTVAFYGEVAEDAVPELSARLERAAGRTEPFEIALRGAGQFGKGAVLWVGVDGDVPVMRRLAERAQAAARKAGIPMDEHRRYRPHLTLAHSRNKTRHTDLRPHLAGLADFAGTAWTVRELCLVRSTLPTSGVPGEQPRYEKVGGWPLGGAG